ncbi:MAG: hypothetical protein M3Q52_06750 [Pseudomonadota bacterium]|nr:hypothetical protein [Pseudomonadota bacterium]
MAATIIATAGAAVAEVPSVLWMGVERVAVVCRSSNAAGQASDLGARVCTEVVRQLGSRTAYPVALVALTEIDPFQDLKVDVHARPAADGGEVVLSVHAGRLGNKGTLGQRRDNSSSDVIEERGAAAQLPLLVERALNRAFPPQRTASE